MIDKVIEMAKADKSVRPREAGAGESNIEGVSKAMTRSALQEQWAKRFEDRLAVIRVLGFWWVDARPAVAEILRPRHFDGASAACL